MAGLVRTRLAGQYDVVATSDLPEYVWDAADVEWQEGVRPDDMIMLSVTLGTIGVHDDENKFVCKQQPKSDAVRVMLHCSMFIGNTRLSDAPHISGEAAHLLALTVLQSIATDTLAKLNDGHNAAVTRESLQNDASSLHVVRIFFYTFL
jgi:hypothetical protein